MIMPELHGRARLVMFRGWSQAIPTGCGSFGGMWTTWRILKIVHIGEFTSRIVPERCASKLQVERSLCREISKQMKPIP